jgi:hypothetical protein
VDAASRFPDFLISSSRRFITFSMSGPYLEFPTSKDSEALQFRGAEKLSREVLKMGYSSPLLLFSSFIFLSNYYHLISFILSIL